MYKLNKFIFDEPTKIICGQGAINDLAAEIKRLGAKSAVVVCDEGIVKAGVADTVMNAAKEAEGVSLSLFDKIIANPFDTTIDAGFEFAKSRDADLIIGVGGGSAMDSAKGIALLMTNGGKTRDYLMDGKVVEKRIAANILIPTTAGTGSEVTRTVVATDSVTKFKDGFKYGDTIFADVAILDPVLMATLPAPVLAACAMDALTHAIESYITWKSNPITDALNEGAIRLIAENIRTAYCRPEDMDAKEALLLASCITGIAFDQAGLGLAHCMGHPMGGLFNVPHGVACAMALPVTMNFNKLACTDKMAKIADMLGADTAGMTKREAAEEAIDIIYEMMDELNLPLTLAEVGIDEKDIPALSRDAMGFPGMRGANPRIATEKDVEALFRELL